MICRRRSEGWEIIFQRNHALLAAEMLVGWKADKRPEPWFQLLNACTQHDHGWQETEDDALIDGDGHPLDFLHMPMDATLAMSKRNLTNADCQSRWCAILVARHAEYLYSTKDDEETVAYVREVKAFRERRMADIGVAAQSVEEMYELLCWADTLSLLVCCDPSEFTRALELSAQGREFEAQESSEGHWTLTPWPYQSQTVELEYEVRYLPQVRYSDTEELRQAIRDASVNVKRVVLRP